MARYSRAAVLGLFAAGVAPGALAQGQPDALAKAFGARETVISASLSPDGQKIALIAAGTGRSRRRSQLPAASRNISTAATGSPMIVWPAISAGKGGLVMRSLVSATSLRSMPQVAISFR